jgi:putative toxin-antitoxin system antitoxin component (TIGR02293 family)
VGKNMHYLTAQSLLGMSEAKAKFHSSLDWILLLRKGINASAIDSLIKNTNLTQAELATVLGIPERTLVRRKQQKKLTSDDSAKLLRIARIVERAEQVFEDHANALAWLKNPNRSLQGETPLNLLDTEIGAESVMDTLGRIEHGVFG